MKKLLIVLFLLAFLMPGFAQATLITIGTAGYDSDGSGSVDEDEYYNLIWDDDNNGNSVVWLDYTNGLDTWENQLAWAASLGDNLTITYYDGYSVEWEDDAWRLPSTVDGTPVTTGYEGDPDNDGVYSYAAGYNLANSEMGHLFYEELGNLARKDTSGNYQSGYGLQNTGDFENLVRWSYWSGTEYNTSLKSGYAWGFSMSIGSQYGYKEEALLCGLALRSGQVSAGDPVPEPATMLLFGVGLVGLIGTRRKLKK